MINKQEQIQDLIFESYSEFYEQNVRDHIATPDDAVEMIRDNAQFAEYKRSMLSKVSNLIDRETFESVNQMLDDHRQTMISLENDSGIFSGGTMPTSQAVAYFFSSFPIITSIYLESIIAQVSTLWPVKSPVLSIPKITYYGKYILPTTAAGYGERFEMAEATTLRRDGGLTVSMSTSDDSSIIALYNLLDPTLQKYGVLTDTWNQEYDLNKVFVKALNFVETKDDANASLTGTVYGSASGAAFNTYVPTTQRFKVPVIIRQDTRNSLKLIDWKYNRYLIAKQTYAIVGGTVSPEATAVPFLDSVGDQHTYLTSGLIVEDKLNLGMYYYSDAVKFDDYGNAMYDATGILFGTDTVHSTSKAKYPLLAEDENGDVYSVGLTNAAGLAIPGSAIWQKDILVYVKPSTWTYNVELIGSLNLDAGTFSGTPKVKKIVGLAAPVVVADCPVKSYDLKIKFSGKTGFNGAIEVTETTDVRDIYVPVSDNFLITTNVESVQNFRDLLKVDLLQGRLDAIKKRMALNMDNELAQLLVDEEPTLVGLGHAQTIDLLQYTTAGLNRTGNPADTLFTPNTPYNVFKGLLLQISSMNDKIFNSKRMFPQFLLAGRNTATMLRNMQGEARTDFGDYSHGKLGFSSATPMSNFQSQTILRSPSIDDNKIYAIYKPEKGSEKYATLLNVVYQPLYQQAFNDRSTTKTMIRSRRSLELIDPKGIAVLTIKNLNTFYSF